MLCPFSCRHFGKQKMKCLRDCYTLRGYFHDIEDPLWYSDGHIRGLPCCCLYYPYSVFGERQFLRKCLPLRIRSMWTNLSEVDREKAKWNSSKSAWITPSGFPLSPVMATQMIPKPLNPHTPRLLLFTHSYVCDHGVKFCSLSYYHIFMLLPCLFFSSFCIARNNASSALSPTKTNYYTGPWSSFTLNTVTFSCQVLPPLKSILASLSKKWLSKPFSFFL